MQTAVTLQKISVNVNPIPVVNNLTNGIEICSGSLLTLTLKVM